MDHWQILKYILFSRPWMRLLIAGSGFLSALFALASPYFQKEFIDQLSSAGFSQNISSPINLSHPLSLILLAFVSLLAAQLFNFASFFYGASEAIHEQKELSEKLYKKTLELRSDSLNGVPVGEVVSLYATDVNAATIFIEQSLPAGASTFFPLLLAPVALVYFYDLPLFPVLSVIFAVALINSLLAFRQSHFFYQFKKLAAERTGMVAEWIQNIRTLRLLGWIESFEEKILEKRRSETLNRLKMVTNGQVMNSISSSVTFIINIVAVLTLVSFRPAPPTPGELLSLLWILGVFLVRPFRQMPWFLTFGFDGWTSIKRLAQFFQIKNAGEYFPSASSASPLRIESIGPSIEVQDLNLSIKGKNILKHINFHIQPKEFVAIVGEVGSGKSTLLLSLMGETQAQFHRYQIDGKNALQLFQTELCRYFSYVPQDGFVMSATLRDNIAFNYDEPEKEDARWLEALDLSEFDLAKERFIEGLDTEIGERGVNLSGGQKQRVSIARAYATGCPIVLLDDSLSALDVDTERKIVDRLLLGRWKDKTRLLATHRLSTLKQVDRILFFKDGELRAQGRLETLLAESAEFREFTKTLEVANESRH